MITMTRTDRLLAAISQELERRRSQLDADCSLRSVSLIAALPERPGAPVRLIFRTESQHEVR
jgi:hypothetical protein